MVCVRQHAWKYQWQVINGTNIVNTQPLPHIIGTCEGIVFMNIFRIMFLIMNLHSKK
jgi:hypothetical protein